MSIAKARQAARDMGISTLSRHCGHCGQDYDWLTHNTYCPHDPAEGAEPIGLNYSIGQAVAVVISCTECEKDGAVNRHRNADTVPLGWFIIDEVGDTGGVFCSTECVDKFRDREAETDRQIAENRRRHARGED